MNAGITESAMATRARRRLVVVTLYGSFLLTGAGTAFSHGRLLAVFPALVCFLAYRGIYKFTRRFAIQTSRHDPVHPDEREAAVRDHAMARSYLVISFLFLLFAGLMGTGQHVRLTDGEWNYVFWAVMLLTSTRPQSLIAWNETDTSSEGGE